VVMDYVQTGKWASVLPRPIHLMILHDGELEAIPMPKTGERPCMGIVIPLREPASALAEAFFEPATSKEVMRRLEDCLRSRWSPKPDYFLSGSPNTCGAFSP
jgi:hypothetical protein